MTKNIADISNHSKGIKKYISYKRIIFLSIWLALSIYGYIWFMNHNCSTLTIHEYTRKPLPDTPQCALMLYTSLKIIRPIVGILAGAFIIYFFIRFRKPSKKWLNKYGGPQ